MIIKDISCWRLPDGHTDNFMMLLAFIPARLYEGFTVDVIRDGVVVRTWTGDNNLVGIPAYDEETGVDTVRDILEDLSDEHTVYSLRTMGEFRRIETPACIDDWFLRSRILGNDLSYADDEEMMEDLISEFLEVWSSHLGVSVTYENEYGEMIDCVP